MITGGKSAGTGMYSFHERHCASVSVMVSHMPDDGHAVRLAFRLMGETKHIMRVSEREAEMLWAALNSMAKDLKWEDFGEDFK